MQTSFDPTNVTVSAHAHKRLGERGFSRAALLAVLASPESVYAAHKYPGQLRVQGNGMSIAFDPKTQTVVTVFFNTTLDPNYDKRSK
jgi:hypothetical protein